MMKSIASFILLKIVLAEFYPFSLYASVTYQTSYSQIISSLRMTILFCSVLHLGVSQSLRHRYVLVNFAEFFRTPFFTVTASILRCSATFNHSHKNGNLFRSYYYDLIDYLRAHLNSSESQLRSRGLDSFFPRKDDFLCLFR